MGDCLKYGKNIYRPEVLFNKIRENAEFFTKKHKITGFNIEQVIGKQSNDIQYSKEDLKNGAKRLINDLFNLVKQNKVEAKPYTIGVLNDSVKPILEKISQLPFRERTEIVVNPSELRHIYNDHYGINEKDKGNNIPLTDNDINSIPDMIANPDKIAFIGKDKRTGNNVFLFAKEKENGTSVVIKVYGNKGGKLSVKSAYVSKKAIDKLIKDELKSALSTPENDFGLLNQRVADLNSDAKIPNLIDFATDDVKKSLNIDRHKAQYSFLKDSDFDANGNVKPQVLKEIEKERTKINNRIEFQIIGENGARNNDDAEGKKESLSLDPRLPKTTIPYKNLNEVAEVLRESGSKEKAFERFKESAWYKNLKDEQKNILNNNKRLRL